MAINSSDIFICGLGYLGKKIIQQLNKSDLANCATLSRRSLEHEWANHYQKDLDDLPDDITFNLTGSCLYYLVPPPSTGKLDLRIRRFLQAINETNLPKRVILISTTGIYGNCADDWVDEQRVPSPDTDRGRRRLDAEEVLQAWGKQHNVKVIILRVAGIYGADRLPLKRLQAGTPVLRLDQSPWSNRIHIDDLVQACLKARHYTGTAVYFNICDGHPSSMSDYFIRVAKAMNLPVPPQIDLDECKRLFSDNMISYLLESKKIDNTRMLIDLGVCLEYPDIQAGLSAICHPPDTEENPG